MGARSDCFHSALLRMDVDYLQVRSQCKYGKGTRDRRRRLRTAEGADRYESSLQRWSRENVMDVHTNADALHGGEASVEEAGLDEDAHSQLREGFGAVLPFLRTGANLHVCKRAGDGLGLAGAAGCLLRILFFPFNA